jgi:catechol 2,3-dioxygenase-like lactoylglutathione lyase family enzyme
MINGAHVIIYASDPGQARAFFRDVLGMPHVDVHDGWLIFKLPPAELGVHPAMDAAPDGHHELYFMCDDVAATVAQLKAKGVEFTTGIEAAGFGLTTRLKVPGAGEIGLYQPRHALAYELEG